MFCRGVGSTWEFQESPSINNILKQGLEDQLVASNSGGDKSTHPLFVVCSGAGTGKSRILDQFKEIAVKVSGENPTLKEKLENSYVFKIDLENGTSYGTFDQPSHYISSRMYYQIADPPISWDDLTASSLQLPTIGNLLESLAVSEYKRREDMAILILVNGLQKLDHQPTSLNGFLDLSSIILPAIFSPIPSTKVRCPLGAVFMSGGCSSIK